MNLKKVVPIIICSGLIVAIGSQVWGQQKPKPSPVPLNPGVVPIGEDPKTVIENPEPVLPDNSHLPPKAFAQKEKIIARLRSSPNIRVIKVSLERWGKHPRGGGISHLVSSGRQVWHLKYEIRNYRHPRLEGLIKRAIISEEFDAATGQPLHSGITILEGKVYGGPSERVVTSIGGNKNNK
jgi:hypothetical protein